MKSRMGRQSKEDKKQWLRTSGAAQSSLRYSLQQKVAQFGWKVGRDSDEFIIIKQE